MRQLFIPVLQQHAIETEVITRAIKMSIELQKERLITCTEPFVVHDIRTSILQCHRLLFLLSS